VAVFAINAFDEDIRPETTAFLKAPQNPYAPDENLYLALIGFDAPEGQPIFSVGEARVAESQAAAEEFFKNPRAGPEILAGSKDQSRTKFKGSTDLCRPLTVSCWTGVESHRFDINSLLEENPALYRRYLALPALRGYFETEAPSPLMRFGYVPGEVRGLFLANTALRIKTGRTAQIKKAALADLDRDVGMWRRMLTGNGGVASKMVAIANLHSDYILLGDMIADPSVDLSPLTADIDDLLAQVTPDNWKLHDVFANEFRTSAFVYQQLKSSNTNYFRSGYPSDDEASWWQSASNRIQGHFFKANATENDRALAMIKLQQMADSDPGELLAAQEEVQRWYRANFGLGPSFLYNPLGKTIIGFGITYYFDYPLRAYDVAAYVRGVRLAYEIRKQKVPASDIPAFIGQHPEWATHPVGGEVFAWDPQAKTLRIRSLGPYRYERRFDIPIWTALATRPKS
jgi:hypothetical protein